MKTNLPEIKSRSFTPINKLSPSRRPSYLKNSSIFSIRKKSLSPVNLSSNPRTSLDREAKPRAFSDVIDSPSLEKDLAYLNVSNIFPKNIRKSKSSSRKIKQMITPINYSEVVNALFAVQNCEDSKLSALNLVSLFVSLGFCEWQQCVEIISDIFEGVSIGLIFFSKEEILKICNDSRTEKMMNFFSRFSKNLMENKLQNALNVVKRTWNHIDRKQLGLVPFDDILEFCHEVGLVENAQDIKRIFIKIGNFGNFKQFSALFSRTLFKMLILELGGIIKQGNLNGLTAQIAITTYRRKTILSSLEGQNRVIDAMTGFFKYRNL
jgi:hypothetical protein